MSFVKASGLLALFAMGASGSLFAANVSGDTPQNTTFNVTATVLGNYYLNFNDLTFGNLSFQNAGQTVTSDTQTYTAGANSDSGQIVTLTQTGVTNSSESNQTTFLLNVIDDDPHPPLTFVLLKVGGGEEEDTVIRPGGVLVQTTESDSYIQTGSLKARLADSNELSSAVQGNYTASIIVTQQANGA